MLDTLKVVDGVGLARPLTQEPDICKKILSGEITGAIQQKFDDNDFGLTNVVAGSQIRQVGRDQAPFDGSKQENVEAFQKDMGTWMEALQKDAGNMEKYGYADMNEVKVQPYGVKA